MTLRVVSAPGASSSRNPYLREFVKSLSSGGVQVDDWETKVGRYDGIIVHWPEAVFGARAWPIRTWKAIVFLLSIFRHKYAGGKVFWVVHNVQPHEEEPFLLRSARRSFLKMVDVLLPLTSAAGDAAISAYPWFRGRPVHIVPHGHYRTIYPRKMAADEARLELGLQSASAVFLFFGEVRLYKGVADLIEAFRNIGDPQAILLIVGRSRTSEIEEEVRRAAALDPRIRLALETISDDLVPAYFAASDLVVLPFKRITHSGSMLLALSLDRPVLVPDVPTLKQMAGPGPIEKGWLHTYTGELKGEILLRVLEESSRRKNGRAPIEDLGWETIAPRLQTIVTGALTSR